VPKAASVSTSRFMRAGSMAKRYDGGEALAAGRETRVEASGGAGGDAQ